MIVRFLCAPGGVGSLRRCAVAGVLLMVLFLAGCPRHIAIYQQADYERATNLKVEALNLMGKATEPYAQQSGRRGKYAAEPG
jgi:hypothetical protein